MQQQQCTAAIGGVVGQAKAGTLLELVQALDLLGVQAHGEVDGVAHRHDLVAPVFHLGIEVGLVLVGVGIQIARRQGRIGLNVVAELDHLDLQAVFFGHFFDLLKNLGVRASRHTNLEGFVLRQRAGGKTGGQGQGEGRLQQGALVHGDTFRMEIPRILGLAL